jgi:hypothetical protein
LVNGSRAITPKIKGNTSMTSMTELTN